MNKSPQRFYQFDSFRVNANERQLWQAQKLVPLTPKVFDILLILLENKGQIMEKDDLLKRIWADTFVEEGSLNRNISTLRKALGDNSHDQKFIKTLPKRGYQFTANVEEIIEEETLVLEKNISQAVFSKDEASLRPSVFQQHRTRTILAILTIFVLVSILVWTFSQSPKSKVDLSGLTDNERQQLAKRGSPNLEAYENYVIGRTLWHQRSAEGLHQSIIHLERAIKNDTNFALAHAALADAYAFDAVKKTFAENHANEALKLDPTLGQPHATIGFMRMFWDWRLSDAKESLRLAIELSPNYATAHQWYAINLIAKRSGGAALAEMKRAVELEPHSLAINADLCQIYYFLQKYDDALEQCKKTLKMDANFLNAHSNLYEIHMANGMNDEAVAEFFRIEQLKSDFSLPIVNLEKLKKDYQNGGIRVFWQTRVEYLEKNPNHYKLAQYYARLGEKEKALQSLQKSYQSRDFDFVLFLTEPVFLDLRDEPRFIELVGLFEQKEQSP